MVCSCNNGQIYATMATYGGAGSCGYSVAPTAALPESAVVPAATPTAAYKKGICTFTVQEGLSVLMPNSPVRLNVTFADNENNDIGNTDDWKTEHKTGKDFIFNSKNFKTSLQGDFIIKPKDGGDLKFSWINPDPKLKTWSSSAKYDINDVPSCSAEDWVETAKYDVVSLRSS